MKLITYNVEYCDGINRRWKYLEVYNYLKLVKKKLLEITTYLKEIEPDILGLIEIDSGSVRFGRKSGTEMFSEELNMLNWVEKTKYSRRSIFKVLNYVPIIRKQGNAILSKYKILDTRFIYLSKGMKRLIINSRVEVPFENEKRVLNLFAVHLSLRKKARAKQLKELAEIVSSAQTPKMVFGDFNNFGGSEELYEFLETTGLKDACKNSYSIKTYPSWKPKRRLDHIFYSDDIIINTCRVLDADFSDHLPLMVDLEFKRNQKK